MSTEQRETESAATAPEDLVAYLDGELSAEESRRVEERLADDAGSRRQLRDLDQAWEALDALPATAVADDFARTTIEMVALDAKKAQGQQVAELVTRQLARRWWWGLGAAMALLGGFVAARWLLPSADATLLAD